MTELDKKEVFILVMGGVIFLMTMFYLVALGEIKNYERKEYFDCKLIGGIIVKQYKDEKLCIKSEVIK